MVELYYMVKNLTYIFLMGQFYIFFVYDCVVKCCVDLRVPK